MAYYKSEYNKNLQLGKGVKVFVTINRVRVFIGDYEIKNMSYRTYRTTLF